MNKQLISLYSHSNGSFIMIGIFSLVIIGLVAAVLLMMSGSKKNKN